jgi:hypothetical protein
MKHLIFALVALVASGQAMADTQHYFRRDGNHVHHLKVTSIGSDVFVAADVDFDPNANEGTQKHCSAAISGEAKKTGDNEITFRKHIEGEAKHCVLKISLTADGAKVEQSPECSYYVTGICHFDSDGKELTRVK